VWGQDVYGIQSPDREGIIPTRVGTRFFVISCIVEVWDHPHACGDKSSVRSSVRRTVGSSPRVWGQVLAAGPAKVQNRIIPTRVGTRHIGNGRRYDIWDHPHACGDKTAIALQAWPASGSSPRVWGQVSVMCWKASQSRIIPTRVGTSCPIISFTTVPKDHPHACGDKRCIYRIHSVPAGSSPRVWGQALSSFRRLRASRIIPTRVGTSKSNAAKER